MMKNKAFAVKAARMSFWFSDKDIFAFFRN